MSGPTTCQLRDVADLQSGGTPSKANPAYWNGSIPWLTPKDMSGYDGSTEDRVTEMAIGNGTRIAPAGASFIAVRGMSLHKEIRVVRPANQVSFNQDIKAVVPKGIDGDFLYYALTNSKPQLLGFVEPSGHGTGVLPTERLETLEIKRLGNNDERAIASVFRAIDNKIDLNRRMSASLEKAASMLFNDWFVAFGPTLAKQEGRARYLSAELWKLFPEHLNEMGQPEGWKMKPLDSIANFLNGLALQKYPAQGSSFLPVIKIAQLRAAVSTSADKAAADIPAAYIVNDGDVIFSWSGSLINRVWTAGRGALNQHLFKVTSDAYPKWF